MCAVVDHVFLSVDFLCVLCLCVGAPAMCGVLLGPQ